VRGVVKKSRTHEHYLACSVEAIQQVDMCKRLYVFESKGIFFEMYW